MHLFDTADSLTMQERYVENSTLNLEPFKNYVTLVPGYLKCNTLTSKCYYIGLVTREKGRSPCLRDVIYQ